MPLYCTVMYGIALFILVDVNTWTNISFSINSILIQVRLYKCIIDPLGVMPNRTEPLSRSRAHLLPHIIAPELHY